MCSCDRSFTDARGKDDGIVQKVKENEIRGN
jgi:hypothetical protein